MGFEHPAALIGLAAALLPLALHLRARREGRVVSFPNVELLRRVASDARAERVVADAGLLLARAGIVVFAAVALARPYLGPAPPARGALWRGDLVLALDRSSGWGDDRAFGPFRAFDEAAAATRDALEKATPPARVALLPFDDMPGPALHGERAREDARDIRPTGPGRPVLWWTRPTGRARAVRPAVDAAVRMLLPGGPLGSTARPGTVVVLTTPEGADELARAVPDDLPARLRVIACAFGSARGARAGAIAGASLDRQEDGAGAKLAVRVRVRAGDASRDGRPRELRLGVVGEARPLATLALPPEEGPGPLAREFLLSARRRRPGWGLAFVELGPPGGGAPVDRRYLTMPPAGSVRVAVLLPATDGVRADC
ncbi:MAG: BatA domain-containing protein, partial [Planctomycetota bacterium]